MYGLCKQVTLKPTSTNTTAQCLSARGKERKVITLSLSPDDKSTTLHWCTEESRNLSGCLWKEIKHVDSKLRESTGTAEDEKRRRRENSHEWLAIGSLF